MRKKANSRREKNRFSLTARKTRDVNLKPISYRGGIRF